MFKFPNWFRLLVGRQVFKKVQTCGCYTSSHIRTFADKPDSNSKQITVRGTENEEKLRVRRARAADAPRVLRFVREHARAAWPGLAAPHLVLADYVARALAQGHSMVAEQQEQRRGWSCIRGLALCVAVCPWDASLLDKWARCVRCTHSKRLIAFTAHCLRAPALHDKYRVHKLLQVILIVPQDNAKTSEISSILAKNAIKRGQDVGFPLIRFDVTSDKMEKILEDLNLKKEWQLSYDVVQDQIKDTENPNAVVITENSNDNVKKDKPSDAKSTATSKDEEKPDKKLAPTFKHRIAIYTTLTQTVK